MFTLEDHPSLKNALGVLLLIGGIALLASMLFALGKDLSLWVFGQTATAQVVDRWVETTDTGEQGELDFRYFVRYRFSTPEGRVIVSTKTVAAQEWVGVGHGSQGQGGADFYSGEAQGPAAPVYREQEHLSEFVDGGLMSAAEVGVVYFPLVPDHNRLDETRLVPLLACTYAPFVVVACLALVVARRLLKNESTQDNWRIEQVATFSAED